MREDFLYLATGCTTAKKRSNDIITNVYMLVKAVTIIRYWTL